MLIGYARVSTDDQDSRTRRALPEEGTSVRNTTRLLDCRHTTLHRAPEIEASAI